LLVLLAMVVGAVGGLGAVVFRLMISAASAGFHALVPGAAHLPSYSVVILPVLGLLLVGVITTYFAREVKGHGVPQILEALALRGGRIRPQVGFFGILAPAITIGSGGSVGREGPIALIGAAFGSALGQLFKLADRYTMLRALAPRSTPRSRADCLGWRWCWAAMPWARWYRAWWRRS